ncbi:hypothetical protein MRY87_06065 [bacterium]|nr:hypothetical protein [bacterium]
MGRPRREIFAGQVYELCIRTKFGLPFVPTQYMNALLMSVMARAQRDKKIIIHHFIWMPNHLHLIFTALDAEKCHRFYGEVQKQLTEIIKKLTGQSSLSLWKGNAASLLPIHDIDTAKHSIAYFYANPARADYVDDISLYPGFSSWEHFSSAMESNSPLLAEFSSQTPWIRTRFLSQLPAGSISEEQGEALADRWKERASRHSSLVHTLSVQPNGWMKAFGIDSQEGINEVNGDILQKITELEQEAAHKREHKLRRMRQEVEQAEQDKATASQLSPLSPHAQEELKKKKRLLEISLDSPTPLVIGREQLCLKPIDLSYIPAPSPRLVVHSVHKELREKLKKLYDLFCERCTYCYERWKLGDFSVKWPPGAIKPPPPNTCNYLAKQVAIHL